MGRALALQRRRSAPRIAEEVFRAPTDATTEVVGVADWGKLQYWTLPAAETTKPFMEEDGRLPGIDDKELMGLVVGGFAGIGARPEIVLCIGVDNMIDVCWIAKWKREGNPHVIYWAPSCSGVSGAMSTLSRLTFEQTAMWLVMKSPVYRKKD